MGGVGSSCATLSPVTSRAISISVYIWGGLRRKEPEILLTGHFVHLIALRLDWMSCLCHRVAKARAIKRIRVFVARRWIFELPALLIAIDAQQPRPRLSVLPDSARGRIALQPLALLLLPSQPEEDRAENRDDAEQPKDRPEKRRDVARHSPSGGRGQNQDAGTRGNCEAGDRGEWPVRGYCFRVLYVEQPGYCRIVIFIYRESGASCLSNKSGQLENPPPA